MNQTPSTLNVPKWDGDPANKPEKDKLFEYEGKTWIWHDCNCVDACCLPEVFEAGQSQASSGMTARIRGTDQGDPVMNFLVKCGFVTMDEIAEACDAMSLIPLAQKVRIELEKVTDLDTWLPSRNITLKEFFLFQRAEFL